MNITFDLRDIHDYERFLAVKRLPVYRITGRSAWFPDEYADRMKYEYYAECCRNLEKASKLQIDTLPLFA